MPSGSSRAGKAASKQARKIAESKQLMTREGRDVLSWLRSNYVIVVGVIGLVLVLAILQFVHLITGVSVFGGGIQHFDLAGDSAIRSALGDGEPWMIFCQHSHTSNLATPAYQKAHRVFTEAATALMATSSVRAAEMDCSRRLEKSGKSVFAVLGLPRNGVSPATVIVAANGRKPTVVRAPFLTSRAKLVKFVAKRTALSSIDIQPGKAGKRAMRKCLGARKCVILAHSGQTGRLPVKAVLTDMMAAHRTVQFATLDTSKAWVSGLPEDLVRVLPRPPNQPQSVARRVSGRGGRVRNVTVSGWGADNAAADGGGQVAIVLHKDPRKPGTWGKANKGSKSSSKRGVIVSWGAADDASGGGWGRLLLSRGNINAAVREADAASQRARAEGGTSGGRTVADVLTAVATPQLDFPNAGAAVVGKIEAIKAPKRITVTSTGGTGGSSNGAGGRGQDQERRRQEALAKSAKRRAARERARAEESQDDDDDDEADARRQRAREAMEQEAQQWVPEAVPEGADQEEGDEYDDEEDALYEEEDEGFEVVEEE